MPQRWIFPAFNAFVCALAGALTGYFVRNLFAGTVIGATAGAAIGLTLEAMLGRLGAGSWLYRRRVLLAVVLEIPFAMFVAGPYAYVREQVQPHPRAVCCQTPLDYGAVSYENVRIQTPDGISLAGWFVPPRERPGALIILLHGAGGDRRGAPWHARQLIAAGYGILSYDQRGLGESSGETISLGWQYRGDLMAVVRYVQRRAEVDPRRIAALGLSRGAHIALNSAYEHPDCFAGLWLDGMGSQRLDDYPEPRDGVEKFEMALNASILKMAEVQLGEPLPPAFTRMLPELDHLPMALVSAGRDDYERRINAKYQRVRGANEELWLIDEAWHTGGPSVVPDEYRQRMLRFFERVFDTPAGECGEAAGS